MQRKICYIVGAGLTKSLEASRKYRVPLMPDFVAILADHIESDVVLTALTNFEKGRVFEWSRPEWIAMADALGVNSTAAERGAYADVLRRRPSENVEQLLRNALKRRKGNLYASIVEDRFSFAINAVFARIGWNLHLDALNRYLTRQFSLPDTEHIFLDYNYDLVLDYCIQLIAGTRWAPESGYGIPFKEMICVEEAVEHMKHFNNGRGGGYSLLEPQSAAAAASEILLLKPHGSLNLLVPFEGNYAFKDDDPLLLLDGKGRIAYCAEFAVEQIRNTRRPAEIAFNAGLFITPPLDDEESASQVPRFLVSVQAQSLAALRDADEIVVIGWSMPSTDKVEVDRLEQAMSTAKLGRKLTAVNFNADISYFQKLAAVCHTTEANVEVSNSGFVDFVDKS